MIAWRALRIWTIALAVCGCERSETRPMTEQETPDRAHARAAMVRDQLRARDITDPRVLDVMSRVPRHLFVSEDQRGRAYDDHPLPIGHGQTISQTYIVEFVSQDLRVQTAHMVVDNGQGSGYQAPVPV